MLIQLLTFIVIFVIPVHTVMQLRCHFCHFQKSQIFAAFYVHLTVTQTPPKWVIKKFQNFSMVLRWTISWFGISVCLRKMTILSCTVSSTKERIFCNYHIGSIRLNYNFLKLMLKMITCITVWVHFNSLDNLIYAKCRIFIP